MIWKGRRLGETPSAHIIGPAPKNNALNAGDDNCTYDDRKVILVKLFLCILGNKPIPEVTPPPCLFCVKCDLYYQWNWALPDCELVDKASRVLRVDFTEVCASVRVLTSD